MVTVEDIRDLSRDEKLRLLEIIWSDLTLEGDDLESPAWHEAALRETEERVASGAERAIDWEEAKALLRAGRQ